MTSDAIETPPVSAPRAAAEPLPVRRGRGGTSRLIADVVAAASTLAILGMFTAYVLGGAQ